MSNYAVICPLEGMEQMAQSQWVAALRKLGHEVKIHNLRTKDVDPRANLPKLVADVLRPGPEIIFVEGGTGFNLPEFYLDPGIGRIPVAAFWYDDLVRPVGYWRRKEGYLEALRRPNVRHFVYDRYWRRWFKSSCGVESLPIHLAADPEDYYPVPVQKEHGECAVFVGTFAGEEHLGGLLARIPPVGRQIVEQVRKAARSCCYATNPYDLLDRVLQNEPAKIRHACETLEEVDRDAALYLKAVVQMLCKNEGRRRILKEALRVAPVLLLCGNLEQTHAGEGEIRKILEADGDRLRVVDTRHVKTSDLVRLFAFGRIHIQATDPQSVEGGIPFRVFQTTACRRPLLTDRKAELAECYAYGEEILTYESDRDFAEKLDRALGDPDRLDRVAEAGYRRFLSEHTWRHRFEYVRREVLTG